MIDAIDLLNELLIFRNHLPNGNVSQEYIDEYNALLTTAQNELEIDLSRFFIKPADIKRDVVHVSYNYSGNPTSVGYGLPYLESNFFLMRLDGAISRIASKFNLERPPVG